MATFSDVITNVERLLRQEAGISVQQYSEDIIGKLLQDSFNRLFDTYFLPEYTNPGETFTLDGTTGQVTDDLSAKITRWKDVRYIWKAPYERPLSRKTNSLNPFSMTGAVPSWEPYNNAKIFRLLPITETGDIVVSYRTKPADFEPNDTMLIDTNIMEAEAALNYIIDDATNPEAIKKFGQQLSLREGDFRVLMNSGPVSLTQNRGAPRYVWSSN